MLLNDKNVLKLYSDLLYEEKLKIEDNFILICLNGFHLSLSLYSLKNKTTVSIKKLLQKLVSNLITINS